MHNCKYAVNKVVYTTTSLNLHLRLIVLPGVRKDSNSAGRVTPKEAD